MLNNSSIHSNDNKKKIDNIADHENLKTRATKTVRHII